MSCEARITELENEAGALRKQVSELKEVLEVELDHLRTVTESQLDEAKQLLLNRESKSLARVAQLEAEVAKLIHICEQALSKEELMSSLPIQMGTPDELNSGEMKRRSSGDGEDIRNSVSNDVLSSGSVSLTRQFTTVEPPTDCEAGRIRSAVVDLQDRLEVVFDFYTAASAANAELLHPAMHLAHFTTMVRDAGLCSGRRPVPPELLWMAVMRSFSSASSQVKAPRRTGRTLLLPRVYDGDENQQERKRAFTRERLQCIPHPQFSEALYVVYCTVFPRAHGSPPSKEEFRRFLVSTFLPAIEGRIHRREPRESMHEFVSVTSSGRATSPSSPEVSAAFSMPTRSLHSLSTARFADVIPSYEKDEGVRQLVRQFSPHLKRAFLKAVQCPAHLRLSEVHMGLEAFIECVRRHDLLPLVTRAQLKSIFLFCLNSRCAGPGANTGECLTYPSFVTTMYCLAEQVYGRDSVLQQQYPSPQARLSKLLVKVFVL
jgi:hypothetical protein